MSKKNKEAESEIPFDAPKVLPAGGAVATTTGEFDYSQYANQGFQDHNTDDYAVPFLGVLQSNSPLLETTTAKAGMLVNTVTKETYDGKDGVVFIPVDRKHTVIEWKPRNQGGGFVAEYAMDSDLIKKVKAEQEFGKWKMVKGDEKSNDLVETFTVWGIFVNAQGAPEQMMISFSSTKIKKYKAWMTKARTIQVAGPGGRRMVPPIFAHKFRITTVAEKNNDGSFYNFNIDFDGGSAEKCRLPTNSELFQAAAAFFEFSKGNVIKPAYDSQTGTSGAEPASDGEVPFK